MEEGLFASDMNRASAATSRSRERDSDRKRRRRHNKGRRSYHHGEDEGKSVTTSPRRTRREGSHGSGGENKEGGSGAGNGSGSGSGRGFGSSSNSSGSGTLPTSGGSRGGDGSISSSRDETGSRGGASGRGGSDDGRSPSSSSHRSHGERGADHSSSHRSGHTSHSNGDADFDLQEIVDHIFRLGEEEEVLKDYHCAIQGKILLHGRMYLSNLRLMFYSNVFGIETRKSIDYKDMSSVEKRNTLYFIPDAIEVATSYGKTYSFSAFYSSNRDSCFDYLTTRVAKAKGLPVPVQTQTSAAAAAAGIEGGAVAHSARTSGSSEEERALRQISAPPVLHASVAGTSAGVESSSSSSSSSSAAAAAAAASAGVAGAAGGSNIAQTQAMTRQSSNTSSSAAAPTSRLSISTSLSGADDLHSVMSAGNEAALRAKGRKAEEEEEEEEDSENTTAGVAASLSVGNRGGAFASASASSSSRRQRRGRAQSGGGNDDDDDDGNGSVDSGVGGSDGKVLSATRGSSGGIRAPAGRGGVRSLSPWRPVSGRSIEERSGSESSARGVPIGSSLAGATKRARFSEAEVQVIGEPGASGGGGGGGGKSATSTDVTASLSSALSSPRGEGDGAEDANGAPGGADSTEGSSSSSSSPSGGGGGGGAAFGGASSDSDVGSSDGREERSSSNGGAAGKKEKKGKKAKLKAKLRDMDRRLRLKMAKAVKSTRGRKGGSGKGKDDSTRKRVCDNPFCQKYPETCDHLDDFSDEASSEDGAGTNSSGAAAAGGGGGAKPNGKGAASATASASAKSSSSSSSSSSSAAAAAAAAAGVNGDGTAAARSSSPPPTGKAPPACEVCSAGSLDADAMATKRHSDFPLRKTYELEGVDTLAFFDAFYADGAGFGAKVFQEKRGDTEVEVSEWVKSEIGAAREINLRAKVNAPVSFGPDTTRIAKTERYEMHVESAADNFSVLVVECSIQTLDIPMGDCFTVEDMVVVSDIRGRPNACVVKYYLKVNFVKSTWFKSVIESQTVSQSGDSKDQWAEMAKAYIASPEYRADRAAASAAAAAADSAAATANAAHDEKADGQGAEEKGDAGEAMADGASTSAAAVASARPAGNGASLGREEKETGRRRDGRVGSRHHHRKGRRRLQDIEIETWLEFVWKLSLLVWSWGVLIALAVIAYSQYKTAGRYDALLEELVASNKMLAEAVAHGKMQT